MIKLWEIPAQVLKQTGLVGIYPLMVLTKDGKRPEVVEEVITTLQLHEGEAAKELISLTYIFAALAFDNEEREEELRRQRQLLMSIVQMHFPNTVSFAQQQVDTIKEPEILQSLIFKVLESQTEEQATECLLSINQK